MALCVVLLTYNRLDYAKTTLKSVAFSLESNEHKLSWHIGSDGDSNEYIASLINALLDHGIDYSKITVSNTGHHSYGKNYNLAMQTAHQKADHVLILEDDWRCERIFNPDGYIADMHELNIGCARLGYIGYTQELRGSLAYGQRCGHWLKFDNESPEPHVFSGHPRIETVEWARTVGPWPEGLLPGATEFEVAHFGAARRRVAWPLDAIKPRGDLFMHIGATRSY